MKRIMTIFKCACVLCVGNINMVFANNVDNQDVRKAAYELAALFTPRGADVRRWYGYDMKIEPAKENFDEGVVRGVVNTPANVIKKSDRYNPIKPTPKKKFALTWNYGEMGDNSGENKAGAFVGQIIGCALILFLIWLAFIKNRKNKTFGWIVLFIIVVLPIHYKITTRNFGTERNSNVKIQINTEQQHNDTPVNIKIDEKLQALGDVNADNNSGLIKITTPEGGKYSFNLFDNNAAGRLNKAVLNATPEQKNFLKYNELLIRNAAGAFNFIRGKEYFINWCYRYYPVDNLHTEFDIFFAPKKIKAQDILSKAGLSEFEVIVKENVELQNAMEQQNNDMYEEIRKKSTQITSELEYCKRFDINAKIFVMELIKNFLFLFPNF